MSNMVRLILTVIVVMISHEILLVDLNRRFQEPPPERDEDEEDEEAYYSLIPDFCAKAMSVLIAILFWRLMGGAWT